MRTRQEHSAATGKPLLDFADGGEEEEELVLEGLRMVRRPRSSVGEPSHLVRPVAAVGADSGERKIEAMLEQKRESHDPELLDVALSILALVLEGSRLRNCGCTQRALCAHSRRAWQAE